MHSSALEGCCTAPVNILSGHSGSAGGTWSLTDEAAPVSSAVGLLRCACLLVSSLAITRGLGDDGRLPWVDGRLGHRHRPSSCRWHRAQIYPCLRCLCWAGGRRSKGVGRHAVAAVPCAASCTQIATAQGHAARLAAGRPDPAAAVQVAAGIWCSACGRHAAGMTLCMQPAACS